MHLKCTQDYVRGLAIHKVPPKTSVWHSDDEMSDYDQSPTPLPMVRRLWGFIGSWKSKITFSS